MGVNVESSRETRRVRACAGCKYGWQVGVVEGYLGGKWTREIGRVGRTKKHENDGG